MQANKGYTLAPTGTSGGSLPTIWRCLMHTYGVLINEQHPATIVLPRSTVAADDKIC